VSFIAVTDCPFTELFAAEADAIMVSVHCDDVGVRCIFVAAGVVTCFMFCDFLVVATRTSTYVVAAAVTDLIFKGIFIQISFKATTSYTQ
jgi:hypothetical protein